MKLRITCTEDQCETTAKKLGEIMEITYISKWYPNTKGTTYSKEGRLYVEGQLR